MAGTHKMDVSDLSLESSMFRGSFFSLALLSKHEKEKNGEGGSCLFKTRTANMMFSSRKTDNSWETGWAKGGTLTSMIFFFVESRAVQFQDGKCLTTLISTFTSEGECRSLKQKETKTNFQSTSTPSNRSNHLFFLKLTMKHEAMTARFYVLRLTFIFKLRAICVSDHYSAHTY